MTNFLDFDSFAGNSFHLILEKKRNDGNTTAQNCERKSIITLELGSERHLFSLMKHNFLTEAKRSCEAQRSDVMMCQKAQALFCLALGGTKVICEGTNYWCNPVSPRVNC